MIEIKIQNSSISISLTLHPKWTRFLLFKKKMKFLLLVPQFYNFFSLSKMKLISSAKNALFSKGHSQFRKYF